MITKLVILFHFFLGDDFFESPAMTVHKLILLLFMCMLLPIRNNHLWLCLEGSIIGGQTLSFGLKSDDHQVQSLLPPFQE